MINVAIASFGMSGKVFHAPILARHPQFRLSKIVERSKDEVRHCYPQVVSVKSYEEIVSDPSIDLVIVNTPDFTHYEYAKQALEAGKHVIVEKPVTQTSEECQALISLAKKRGKLLSVFQNRRWDGDFLTVKKIIEEKLLGRLVEFESNYMRYRNFIQENTWKESVALGKGVTYNLGSHMIDQAVTLFGMPQAVWADIDSLRSGSEIDDYYHLRLVYPQLKVTLKATYLAREETPRYIVHGTEGSYIKHGLDPQEEQLKKGENPFSEGWGKEPESDWGVLNTEINGLHYRGKVETTAGNYVAYYDSIYDAILKNKALSVLPEESMTVLKIIEAAFESTRTGKTISLK